MTPIYEWSYFRSLWFHTCLKQTQILKRPLIVSWCAKMFLITVLTHLILFLLYSLGASTFVSHMYLTSAITLYPGSSLCFSFEQKIEISSMILQNNYPLNQHISPFIIHVPIYQKNPSWFIFSSTICCSFHSHTVMINAEVNKCYQWPLKVLIFSPIKWLLKKICRDGIYAI